MKGASGLATLSHKHGLFNCGPCPSGVVGNFYHGSVRSKLSVVHVFSTLGSIRGVGSAIGCMGHFKKVTSYTIYCAVSPCRSTIREVITTLRKRPLRGPIFAGRCFLSGTLRVRTLKTSVVAVGSVDNLVPPKEDTRVMHLFGGRLGIPMSFRARYAPKCNLTSILTTVIGKISIISAGV